MTLEVRQFPCLKDNYGYLIRDPRSGKTAAIDTPDAAAILANLKASGWGQLDYVFNTHWHADHTGGNAALKAETGCWILGPAEVGNVAPLDQVLSDGDAAELGDCAFNVIGAPGHTLGHILYWSAEAGKIFVGDTLFPLGCGRMFEGAPDQFWGSLSRIMALPPETQIYCAHEYTLANARFAASVDASEDLARRIVAIEAMRATHQPTTPSRLADELETNPFLRAPRLRPDLAPVEAFAALRAAKDVFA